MLITQKEMQYVDAWANRIPMPGLEYSRLVMEDMKKCYQKYVEKCQNKEYTFLFSNGEEINFEILSANLCHMLGIDYSNIKSDYFLDYRSSVLKMDTQNFSSFELLETILEHSEKIIELDNDPSYRIKLLNYYKSQIKCNIFNKLSNFENFDFAAINYDPKDGKFAYENQKLLFVPSNEILFPYFMMGIKLSNPEETNIYLRKYIVSTLLAPQNPKEYLDGHEVIIPTQLLISDNYDLKKLNATASEKIKLLTMYKNIVNEFRIPNKLNISADYEAMLNDIANSDKNQKVLKGM